MKQETFLQAKEILNNLTYYETLRKTLTEKLEFDETNPGKKNLVVTVGFENYDNIILPPSIMQFSAKDFLKISIDNCNRQIVKYELLFKRL